MLLVNFRAETVTILYYSNAVTPGESLADVGLHILIRHVEYFLTHIDTKGDQISNISVIYTFLYLQRT